MFLLCYRKLYMCCDMWNCMSIKKLCCVCAWPCGCASVCMAVHVCCGVDKYELILYDVLVIVVMESILEMKDE